MPSAWLIRRRILCFNLLTFNLPYSQGIGLTVDQYTAFLKAIPAINAELRSRGHDITDDSDGGGAPVVAKPEGNAKKSTKKQEKKANIEATSDEGSGSD